VFHGPTEDALQRVSRAEQRAWVRGRAYRVLEPGQGGAVTVNPGVGSGAEYRYHPATREATLSLGTLAWWYRRTHRHEVHPKGADLPPTLGLPRVYTDADLEKERQVNPTMRSSEGGLETVSGQPCRVVMLTYHQLADLSGRTLPDIKHTARLSIALRDGLVVREVLTSHWATAAPPQPRFARVEVTLYELTRPARLPDSLFRLPPGTVCLVPEDYTLPLPPG
jgi:hypothetical protein